MVKSGSKQWADHMFFFLFFFINHDVKSSAGAHVQQACSIISPKMFAALSKGKKTNSTETMFVCSQYQQRRKAKGALLKKYKEQGEKT